MIMLRKLKCNTCGCIDSGSEAVTIGNWGHVTSTGITEAIIVGTYELNHRVRLYINLDIYE